MMSNKGLFVAVVCTLFSVGLCFNSNRTPEEPSSGWFSIFSCVTKQVPKLPKQFNKPLYQYLFESFAKNTHLLPLGVPMNSDNEDYESTAELEYCLWGTPGLGKSNEIDAEGKEDVSAYHQIFARRESGYDYITGLSLLGGKMVASLVGYVVHALLVANPLA